MIVVSGALVLVAGVLLVFGIVWSIPLVYAAIVLSIVSAFFLLASIFQRPPRDSAARLSPPGRPSEGQLEAQLEDEPMHASGAERAEFPLEPEHPDFERRAARTGADVLVVSGRPRYHVAGCPFVEDPADAEPLEIREARELGFTPCGECRPNESLATR